MLNYIIRQNTMNDKQYIQFEAVASGRYIMHLNSKVNEKEDELRKDNGEYTYLVEEYSCCYIYDVLEQLYDDFVYLLQGVNDFNVKLDGV